MSVETMAGPGVTQAPAAPPSERRGHPGWLLAVCCVAQFMVILDLSIVNVALPSIQSALGFSAPELQWVVDAYAITFAGALMLGGRAADHFGQRRTFVVALVLFGVTSLAGGVAPNQGVLIANFPYGRSVFSGLDLSLKQQIVNFAPGIKHAYLQLSFSRSKYVSQSDDSGLASLASDYASPTFFTGPTDLDRKNQFAVGGYFDLPRSLRLGLLGHFASPLPSTGRTPKWLTSLPAREAMSTIVKVMGRKISPVCSGDRPSTCCM